MVASMSSTSRHQQEVTRLLAELERGDADAATRLFPIVYDELRALAGGYLRRERPGHTLQPTALVHEAFLKLVGQKDARYESRGHFLAIAATAMRRVLVRHAEKRASAKRGGGQGRADFTALFDVVAPSPLEEIDHVALDQALQRLGALDERKARTVELRYYAGLSVEETAAALATSPATVKRDWEFAKAWLLRELEPRKDARA
jgi:RNA polymerase sigma-70 factor (ECF subfamily)